MSTRVVKLKLMTQQSLVVIETGVRTFEEFKALPEVVAMNLQWDQIALIDRATRNTISLDWALLPNTDCILFVQPMKTKSGAATRSELYATIKEMQANGVEVPFNMTQTRTSVLEEFIEDNEVRAVESHCDSECKYQITQGLYQIINSEDGSIILRPVETGLQIEPTDYDDILDELADFVTNDELALEQDSIQNELK